MCPVDQAVTVLQNNAIRTISESKGVSAITYPPELVGTMRGMFPAGRSYAFQIHGSATLQATGGGVISFAFPFSPLVSSFSEWTALAALFDEVRLIRSKMTWTSGLTNASTTIPTQVCVAPDLIANTAVTPSFTAVQRLAESREIGLGPFMEHGMNAHFAVRIPGRIYATTAAPATTSPPAGCVGAWVWASAVVTTASAYYGFISVRNVVKLRMRA